MHEKENKYVKIMPTWVGPMLEPPDPNRSSPDLADLGDLLTPLLSI
jgi:hypothetical protein